MVGRADAGATGEPDPAVEVRISQVAESEVVAGCGKKCTTV